MPLTKVKSGGVSDSITLTSPDINAPDIDGGTIDNAVIGGSTAAAGSFTTITATGGSSSNWNTAYGWGDHSTQSYATQTYVGTEVSNLVDSSPAALDTLNELAAALGDDPNFATTVTNSIALKAPLASPSFTGNVGIGKAAPAYILDIEGASPRMWMKDTTASGSHFEIGVDTSAVGLGNRANLPLNLFTNNTTRMTIGASGNVGIGMNPDANNVLSVKNTSGKVINLTNGVDADLYVDLTSGLTLVSPSTGTLAFGTSNTERMRITSSGDILGKTADVRIGSDVGSVEYGTSTANSVRFYSADTERMRIDASGDLIKVGGVIKGERGTAAAPPYTFSDDTDTGMFNISNADLGFSVGGTERMRIHASGAVTKPYQPSTVFTSSSGITLYHDSVWRKIPLNSTKHQTGGNHFSTSNNRFTAPVAGRYLFGMDIQLESVVGNIVWMYLVPLVNGNRNANNGQAFADFTPSNTTYNRQTGTFLLNLSASDYVEMWHIGSGNGTVVLKPNTESSFFLTLL